MNRFIIVGVKHHTELEPAVNDMIEVGYLPIGSPYVAPDNKYAQAMLLNNQPTKLTKKEKTGE
jgi:hypothetical protein